jgi:hypothetical protein
MAAQHLAKRLRDDVLSGNGSSPTATRPVICPASASSGCGRIMTSISSFEWKSSKMAVSYAFARG